MRAERLSELTRTNRRFNEIMHASKKFTKSVRFVESQPCCERSFKCSDAVAKPVVEDPMDDDRIPVESRAEVTLFHLNFPSRRKRNMSSLTSHFNHGARHA